MRTASHSNLSPFAKCSSLSSSMLTTLESITLIGYFSAHDVGASHANSAIAANKRPTKTSTASTLPGMLRPSRIGVRSVTRAAETLAVVCLARRPRVDQTPRRPANALTLGLPWLSGELAVVLKLRRKRKPIGVARRRTGFALHLRIENIIRSTPGTCYAMWCAKMCGFAVRRDGLRVDARQRLPAIYRSSIALRPDSNND